MQEYYNEDLGIYYRTNIFRGDRPTLVFVHGITGCASAWSPYEKFFENDCNVLTYDLRGHGFSKRYWQRGDYAMEKFAEDLSALLASLDIGKFTLIGHSFGSLVALEFLERHMEMAEKLVLISPNDCPSRLRFANAVKMPLKANLVLGLFKKGNKKGGHLDYALYYGSGDWNLPRMIADIRNTGIRIWLYGMEMSYRIDYAELLPRIAMPALIIHGRHDSIFPVEAAVRMRDKIKNSRIEIIENSNHILVLNNFPELSAAISRFIGLPSSGALS